MLLLKRHALVAYEASAEVDEGAGTVRADLGAIGFVDLAFRPDGGVAHDSSRCSREQISFQSGFFEGTFRLHGEEGYTQVDLQQVKPNPGFFLDALCPDLGTNTRRSGAELTATRRMRTGSIHFEARKAGLAKRSFFSATISERRGGLRIGRTVETVGSPSAFDFSVTSPEALLDPPSPFSGAARFDGEAPGPDRLRGNLEVDFPGHSDVALAGAAFSTAFRSKGLARNGARTSCLDSLAGLWTSSSRSPVPCSS